MHCPALVALPPNPSPDTKVASLAAKQDAHQGWCIHPDPTHAQRRVIHGGHGAHHRQRGTVSDEWGGMATGAPAWRAMAAQHARSTRRSRK
jgi:hypothetical protein